MTANQEQSLYVPLNLLLKDRNSYASWMMITGTLASFRPSSYNWLNQIHLNFNLNDFVFFFGIHIDSAVRIVQRQGVRGLLKGPPGRGLRHLELYLRDPYRFDGWHD